MYIWYIYIYDLLCISYISHVWWNSLKTIRFYSIFEESGARGVHRATQKVFKRSLEVPFWHPKWSSRSYAIRHLELSKWRLYVVCGAAIFPRRAFPLDQGDEFEHAFGILLIALRKANKSRGRSRRIGTWMLCIAWSCMTNIYPGFDVGDCRPHQQQ